MPMREDCRHFASRTYDDGEVARFCQLDLAPEAPWRCPADCAHYAPGANDGSFETASLEHGTVEAEPTGESPEAIADLLDDAERILDEAEPDVLRDVEAAGKRRRQPWWKRFGRNKPDGGDDWHLSSR